MFNFERTADYGLLEIILSNPRAYGLMANDQAPPLEQFRARPGNYTPVICRSDDGMLVGLFLLVASGAGVAEVHFCFTPGSRWKMIPAGKQFIEWVWRETSVGVLLGLCPSYNRVAHRVAKRCGFKWWWTENHPWQQKDGKPFSLRVTAIRRPSFAERSGDRALPS